jgi:hypothetical protein
VATVRIFSDKNSVSASIQFYTLHSDTVGDTHSRHTRC